METIKFSIDESMFQKADNFSVFREDCKTYLSQVGKNWDKFTLVSHDSFVGYLSEKVFISFLQQKFPHFKISSWEGQFDMRKIINIINTKDKSDESINLVIEYFYDKWDVKIEHNGTTVYCDVKTALTRKEPSGNWNFLYPVIQANKLGKDVSVLLT